MVLLSLLAAIILGCVHLFAAKLMFIRHTPRGWWLSFAGGTSVAYVFVHLFPEISAAKDGTDSLGPAMDIAHWLESKRHLIALSGITVYYALERWARTSRQKERQRGMPSDSCTHVFWLHISSFAIYVAAVGYLLHGEHFDAASLALFTVALGLHFLFNDYGLQELHDTTYQTKGRYILAAAPLVGWVLGWLGAVPEHLLSAVVAFLAGGIILNVLKEELPAEREARIIPFVLGVAAYTFLLLALE